MLILVQSNLSIWRVVTNVQPSQTLRVVLNKSWPRLIWNTLLVRILCQETDLMFRYGHDEMACHLQQIVCTWDTVTMCTPVNFFFPLGVQLFSKIACSESHICGENGKLSITNIFAYSVYHRTGFKKTKSLSAWISRFVDLINTGYPTTLITRI